MDKAPYIGKMDRKVSIYSIDTTKNTLMEDVNTKVLVTDAWAYMQEKSNTEDVEGKVFNLIKRTYTVYMHPDIRSNGREYVLEDNGTTYYIDGVLEIGRTHLMLTVRNYE